MGGGGLVRSDVEHLQVGRVVRCPEGDHPKSLRGIFRAGIEHPGQAVGPGETFR